LARASEKKPKKKKVRPKGAKNKPRAKAPKKEVKKEKPKIKSKEKAERELISASEAVVKAADAKPTSITAVKASKSALTAADAAAKAEAEARAALERSKTAKKAVEAAAEDEYKAAAAEVVIADAGRGLTNKRGAERIFRREMGEPEFWQEKNERAPLTPVLSQTQEEQISRQVQIPQDQTPEYNPQHILSPEFAGVSSYEREIKNQREELEQRLIRLKNDPNASNQEIKLVEEDLKTLDYLYENYYMGMNVFRTAKGGRNKLRV
jgi:colicin import membrane protein